MNWLLPWNWPRLFRRKHEYLIEQEILAAIEASGPGASFEWILQRLNYPYSPTGPAAEFKPGEVLAALERLQNSARVRVAKSLTTKNQQRVYERCDWLEEILQ